MSSAIRSFVACLLCLPVCSRATDTFWTDYFEAENFSAQTGGNKASSEYFPYIGDGYLEMGGKGATVTWNNITVPETGKYTLILKYANNTLQDRPCDLKVNGALIKNISFGPFPKNWAAPWPDAKEYSYEKVGWAKYWNARVIVGLRAGANTLELIATSEEGGPHIDNIGVSVAMSEPPGTVVNVKDYGAVGDGSTDNSEAIANAIAACPVGGSVVFDEGIYMTGSITLKANMTLWISENAVIRAIQDNDKIGYYAAGSFGGDYITKYLMFGDQVDNLTITGGGAIDGNSVNGYTMRPFSLRLTVLGFVNSKNVTVTNVDLLNSDFWTFVPQKSDGVIIDGINLFLHKKDGIAPLDCHDMSITNSVIECGDDALTPKSYTSRGIDNLVVRNVTINSTKWKGIKFGHSTVGDFTNSLFEDLAFVHVEIGISIVSSNGANVSNLKFNRINMRNIRTPLIILNGGEGASTMKDISISNIDARDVYDPHGRAIMGTRKGDDIHKVENVSLTNVSVESFKGGLSTVPDSPPEFYKRPNGVVGWTDFPSWGYFIRHAENVVFENVTHSVSPEDVRKDIVLENVVGFVKR